VVSACAFDSVPADLGVCFAASCLPQGYHLHTVESFLSIDTGTTLAKQTGRGDLTLHKEDALKTEFPLNER
jgi:short subunit dehydrogenase-like uncharacterized protein